MTECQESGCRVPATKSWNGRKVCDDHYDKYKEEYERMTNDMGYGG